MQRLWRFAVASCIAIAVGCGAQCDSPTNSVINPPAGLPATPGLPSAPAPAPNPPVGSTPSAAATLLEQLSLERINRARLLPAAESQRYGIAVDEGIPGRLDTSPKQPVAMNATLRLTAADHSKDMLSRNYFAHDTPEGKSPFDRMSDNAYAFVSAGENLAWRGTTGTLDPIDIVRRQHEDLFVDQGISGRGHRVTMLNDSLREVGISIQRGSFTRLDDGRVFSDSIMQTQDYGTAPDSGVFVLGVVFDDANQNGEFDHGEGIANSAVSLGSVVKSTNQAGGYEFRVNEPGTYALKFSQGPSQSVTIKDGGKNIKIDLIDRSRVVINFGLGSLD
jgi:serralysin